MRSFSSRTARLMALGVLPCVAFVACDSGGSSSQGSGGTTTTTGDNKYYPEPNGVHTTEKAACDALVDAQSDKLFSLKCVATGQTCPSFLRAEFKTACMEYDEGSVKGCVEYYKEQQSCDGLKNAIETCIVTAYPGTEPAGCPMIDGGGGMGGTGGTGAREAPEAPEAPEARRQGPAEWQAPGGMAGSGGVAGSGGMAGSRESPARGG
ncbi:MAG: hypothetical protein R3F14_41045 [Polyangiaceae bacterium]